MGFEKNGWFKQIDPGQVLVLSPGRHFGYAIRDELINLGDIPITL